MRIDELVDSNPVPNGKTFHYLSYGMNCDPRVMSTHLYCKPIGAVILPGYHLTFAAFANIEVGGKMGAVLWEIDKTTLAALDKQEGYPHFYDKRNVKVAHKGQPYSAIVYIMTPESAKEYSGINPSKSYIKNIVNGYQTFGIPMEQIRRGLSNSQVTVEGIEI